jgi:hypothetical protein
MNTISSIRHRVARHGKTTITALEYDQLQKEWITRAHLEYLVEENSNMKKAIHDIAPWVSASLDDDSCEEYKKAAYALFELDETDA